MSILKFLITEFSLLLEISVSKRRMSLSYRFIMNSAIILLIWTALGVFAIPTAISATGLKAGAHLISLRHSELFHAL